MWVALLVGSWVVSLVSSTFRSLRTQDRVFWSLALVRAVFGGIFAPLGAYCALVDMRDGSVVSGTTPLSYWLICNALGFFLFECFALFASNVAFRQFDMLLFIHHTISLGGFTAILYSGHLHMFGTMGLCLEVSTPFTAVSWITWKMGYASTTIWKLNQMLMVHAFHGRSFVEFSVWIMTFRHRQEIFSTISWTSIIAFYPPLALMSFLLTPSWLFKKTRQLTNSLSDTPSSSSSSSVASASSTTSQSSSNTAWAAIYDPDVLSRISSAPRPIERSSLDKRRLKTM